MQCADGPAKVELGLHGEPARELAALLPSLEVHKRREVTWVEPAVHVVISHHGRAAQPRDATFAGVV